jgi:hypothetical protein
MSHQEKKRNRILIDFSLHQNNHIDIKKSNQKIEGPSHRVQQQNFTKNLFSLKLTSNHHNKKIRRQITPSKRLHHQKNKKILHTSLNQNLNCHNNKKHFRHQIIDRAPSNRQKIDRAPSNTTGHSHQIEFNKKHTPSFRKI